MTFGAVVGVDVMVEAADEASTRNKSGVPGLADPKITKPKCWDEWKPVETTGQLTVNRSTAQGSKMMLDGDA